MKFNATAPRGHQPHQVPVASSPTTNLFGVGTTAVICTEDASFVGTLSGPKEFTLDNIATPETVPPDKTIGFVKETEYVYLLRSHFQ